MDWEISDAKNKLGEVLDRADDEGPQIITRYGRTYAVVRGEDFHGLPNDRTDFLAWLMDGPSLDGVQIPPRDMTPPREIDL